MTKSKSDYPQTEVEITPEIRELLEGFTAEEIETGVIVADRPPVGPEGTMFEDLMESLKEAGAILRGEKEAARITRFEESGDVIVAVPGGADASGSSESSS